MMSLPAMSLGDKFVVSRKGGIQGCGQVHSRVKTEWPCLCLHGFRTSLVAHCKNAMAVLSKFGHLSYSSSSLDTSSDHT